jgi:2-polyprenyl-3-methyl-5-hydroxy-6-metoxy-1,4-benzoquinol methylase
MNLQLKSCPICEGSPAKIFTKRGYDIGSCKDCDHTYIVNKPCPNHLKKVYDDSYFTGGGDGYPNYANQEELLIAHGRRYGRLLLQYMPPGRVLDVGAAAGFILKGLIEEGWQGDGIEPNASMAQLAQNRYGLNVRVGLEKTPLEDQSYDVITMIQVAAHFYDVRRAFAAAAKATKPGGWWLIETSNEKSLPARLLGENWHFISPPSVQNWFTHDTLAKLAGQYGLTPVATGRPQKWINSTHAKSLLQHKMQGLVGRGIKLFMRLMPDNVSLPYPSLDLMWMLLHKNKADE